MVNVKTLEAMHHSSLGIDQKWKSAKLDAPRQRGDGAILLWWSIYCGLMNYAKRNMSMETY